MFLFISNCKYKMVDNGSAWRCTLAVFMSVILLLHTGKFVSAFPAEGHPVKINLESDRQTFFINESAVLKLRLLTAANTPAVSPDNLSISVEIVKPSGEKLVKEMVITRGKGTAEIYILLDEAGLFEARAGSDQLLDGGVLFSVMDTDVSARDFNSRDTSDGINLDLILDESLSDDPNGFLQEASGPELEVSLRVYPEEPRLADGKDAATIYAYLQGKNAVAPENIQIILHNRGGVLDPNVLLIEKGNFRGQATLISQNKGQIAVDYMDANPPVRLSGERTVAVNFRTPVTSLEFKASPSRISMLEKTRLIVRMLDHKGQLLTEDRDRTVYFTINEGYGELVSDSAVIPAGEAQAAVRFNPTNAGIVVVQAKTPNILVSERVNITVTWPWIILLITICGALTGGALSWVLKEDARWWLILTGLVFGFILYWAVLFGLIRVMPEYLIQNPFSAFSIATIGGWLGPKAMDPVLKRFGISTV